MCIKIYVLFSLLIRQTRSNFQIFTIHVVVFLAENVGWFLNSYGLFLKIAFIVTRNIKNINISVLRYFFLLLLIYNIDVKMILYFIVQSSKIDVFTDYYKYLLWVSYKCGIYDFLKLPYRFTQLKQLIRSLNHFISSTVLLPKHNVASCTLIFFLYPGLFYPPLQFCLHCTPDIR